MSRGSGTHTYHIVESLIDLYNITVDGAIHLEKCVAAGDNRLLTMRRTQVTLRERRRLTKIEIVIAVPVLS